MNLRTIDFDTNLTLNDLKVEALRMFGTARTRTVALAVLGTKKLFMQPKNPSIKDAFAQIGKSPNESVITVFQ